MREALPIAAWADDRARRERRARVAVVLAAVASAFAWSTLSPLVERAYWDAARVPPEGYAWRDTAAFTAVCVRLLAGFTPIAVLSALLTRRAGGARAATAAWFSLTLLGALCVTPAYWDLVFRSPVDRDHGRTCFGGPWSGWEGWWMDVSRALGWYRFNDATRLYDFLPRWEPGYGFVKATPWLVVTAVAYALSRRLGPRFDAVARFASRAALALSVVALTASGWALLTRPQPADYVSTLPVLATLPSEEEAERSPRRPLATPMAFVSDTGGLFNGAILDGRSTHLDHRVGAVALRHLCRRSRDGDFTSCRLHWRSETWRHWLSVEGAFGARPTQHRRVDLRQDTRTRTAYLTLGSRVIAGLHLDVLPTEEAWATQSPEGWFCAPPRALVAMVRLPVAPYLSAVGLALAGLLATLLLRALDRGVPTREELPRGYRDAPPLSHEDARIDAWRRDDAVEPAWRALAILSLTHAPLVAWYLARAFA